MRCLWLLLVLAVALGVAAAVPVRHLPPAALDLLRAERRAPPLRPHEFLVTMAPAAEDGGDDQDDPPMSMFRRRMLMRALALKRMQLY